jgi:hypothetical protein
MSLFQNKEFLKNLDNLYNKKIKDVRYEQIEKSINSIRRSLTRDEESNLKKLYINSRNRNLNNEIIMENKILDILDKKIKETVNKSRSTKSNERKRKYQNRQKTIKKLPSIVEDAHSQSKSKSRGGRNTRKNMKKSF